MTVCIAATCESGKNIVVAADRMLTYTAPLNLEFETDEQKIEQIGENSVALMAGNTAYAIEVLQSVRNELAGNSAPPISKVVELVKQQYSACRMNKFNESTITAMLGIDFERFIAKGGTLPQYLQPQSGIYQQLVVLSQQYNFGVDFIVGGIDKTGSHIFVVTNPGLFYLLKNWVMPQLEAGAYMRRLLYL